MNHPATRCHPGYHRPPTPLRDTHRNNAPSDPLAVAAVAGAVAAARCRGPARAGHRRRGARARAGARRRRPRRQPAVAARRMAQRPARPGQGGGAGAALRRRGGRRGRSALHRLRPGRAGTVVDRGRTADGRACAARSAAAIWSPLRCRAGRPGRRCPGRAGQRRGLGVAGGDPHGAGRLCGGATRLRRPGAAHDGTDCRGLCGSDRRPDRPRRHGRTHPRCGAEGRHRRRAPKNGCGP